MENIFMCGSLQNFHKIGKAQNFRTEQNRENDMN